MDISLNEKEIKNIGQINISFELLKECLNLRDNIDITDAYVIRDRQNILSIVLRGEDLGSIVTADIRPVYDLKELGK